MFFSFSLQQLQLPLPITLLLLLPITQAVTPIISVVTMANVFLTATHVTAIMTVEITVMKTDVVCYIMVCIVYIYCGTLTL